MTYGPFHPPAGQPQLPQPPQPPQGQPSYGQPQPDGQQPYGQQQAWGPGTQVVEPQPRPDVPRAYPQLLRGPKHAWWRPLVSIAMMLGLLIVLVVVAVVVMVVAVVVSGVDAAAFSDESALLEYADEPWFVLANNLLLAAFIPMAMVSVWVGHGWRPRWLSSVTGGIRWRWLLATAGVALVVQVVATLVLFSIDGFPTGEGHDVVWLLLIVALTTPLQAAGEEYFFRGWLTQTIGSWIPAALVSALLTAALASTLFALAHGSQNIWLFLDRFAFGVLASYLTWRTGGLEAAIGAHAVNNIVVFVPTILTGGVASALAVSDVPVETVLADIVVMVVVGALIVLLARRMGIQREYAPPGLALVAGPGSGGGAPGAIPPPAGPLLVPPGPLG